MRTFVAVMLVLAGLLTAIVAQAGNVNLSKGKTFYESQMWDKSIQALEKAIEAEPSNAEAHYLLGKAYLKKGNSYKSNERFKSAIAIDLLRKKLSPAILHLDANQLLAARSAFDDVIEQHPLRRRMIATQIFDYGLKRLKERSYEEANVLIGFAISYDFDLSLRACDIYYRLANISDDAAVDYASQIQSYCRNTDKRRAEIGERILRQAKMTIKGPYRSCLKEKALWLLPLERVEEVLPPPRLKPVLSRKYIGRGFGEHNYVETVQFGNEILIDDQIVVEADQFEIYRGGKWEPYRTRCQIINYIGKEGALGVKVADGVEFTVTILRMSE